MHDAAPRLGAGRVEQVGANRGRGMDPKQQDQQRRHQRAAPHAGHANEKADRETGGDIERIDQWHRRGLRSRWVIARLLRLPPGVSAVSTVTSGGSIFPMTAIAWRKRE